MNFTDREIVSLFFNVARLSRNIPGTKGNDLLPFIGQYRCLLLLENSGPMNQKGLADALQIRPASLGELLVKLEEKGLIRRTPSEKDRRSLIVSLTDSGKEQLRDFHRQREQAYCDMLTALSTEEKEQFYQILSKIQDYYLQKEQQD